MRRNIRLAYFLSFAFHTWFWMGNWIFFYLKFGDYAGIALIDSGSVLMSLLAEIPTGALTDLMGKKKALMVAFLLQSLGSVLMGLASSFWMLALSLWLLVCVGGAFYSGTIEALLYDSLKSLKEEHLFGKKMSIINATRLWSMAICSMLGGLAYYLFPGLPFVLGGVVGFTGFIACLYLVEPKIDSEKYSWSSFFKQNTLGIKTLFKDDYMKRLTLFLVATGGLSIVIYNLLDDLLAVEYGYTPAGISILFAIACLVAGLASILVPRMKKKINEKAALVVSMIVIALLLAWSPWIGMLMSGGFLILRVILEVIYDNATSVAINHRIESKVRATTLSSLSLLRNIPYGVGGVFIGSLVQVLGGARIFSFWFGVMLMILTVLLGMRLKRPNTD